MLCFAFTYAQTSAPTISQVEDGYLFHIDIKSPTADQQKIASLEGVRIDVYNNTKDEEELVLDDYKLSNFEVKFEKGNHYTLMIRKEGYFNKRIEAYVNIKGCILCLDGIGQFEPNVADALTSEQSAGSFLADVEMQAITLNSIITIDNIYYDLAKWEIRPDAARELDKVVTVLKEHPSIIMELGSHTDARGRDKYNKELSEKRAQAAVNYIVHNGGIEADRIVAKGYGETVLTNRCTNGVDCSEAKHQENRRTELKILGVKENEAQFVYSPLSTIIRAERMDTSEKTEAMGTSDF
ncbi:MAG: OmpA family protein [Bacteroidota bacterium]